eukprot:TRINITY_DN7017_c0_g1_i1.p1 TRINITY_DN7017_c0_g1~~TRINITY_DN7017_c0_g1_i1.p1  ORF type:complete len:499 (-),score=104.65 TRINITY_DN7017_c0_g1_i1:66-1562(-)
MKDSLFLDDSRLSCHSHRRAVRRIDGFRTQSADDLRNLDPCDQFKVSFRQSKRKNRLSPTDPWDHQRSTDQQAIFLRDDELLPGISLQFTFSPSSESSSEPISNNSFRENDQTPGGNNVQKVNNNQNRDLQRPKSIFRSSGSSAPPSPSLSKKLLVFFQTQDFGFVPLQSFEIYEEGASFDNQKADEKNKEENNQGLGSIEESELTEDLLEIEKQNLSQNLEIPPNFEEFAKNRAFEIGAILVQKPESDRPSHSQSLFHSSSNTNQDDDYTMSFECKICYEHIARHSLYLLSCGHFYCFECLKDYFRHLISPFRPLPKLICPYPNCLQLLSEKHIRGLIQSEQDLFLLNNFRSSQELSRRLSLSDPTLIWCNTSLCNSIVDLGKKPRPTKCECPSCHVVYCTCGLKWHDGGRCFVARFREKQRAKLQNRQETLSAVWKKQNFVKKCPSCGVEIQKSAGCNHMTCAFCKHQFCWICFTPYETEHFRDEKSPCYGKLFQT